jgi:hypothetical protein
MYHKFVVYVFLLQTAFLLCVGATGSWVPCHAIMLRLGLHQQPAAPLDQGQPSQEISGQVQEWALIICVTRVLVIP